MTDAALLKVPEAPTKRPGVVRRLLKDPFGSISLAVLLLFLLGAVLAPWITSWDPNATNITSVLTSPGEDGHLLGTDSAGRDIFARILYGAQLTFAAGALATIVAILIGVPAGLIAGFYGGWFDSVSSWFANMLLALPGIVVLLAVRAALGPSVWYSMAVFGVLLSPSFFRLVRGSVQSVRNDLYIDAAAVSGLNDLRIISRHVLYVVRAPIVIQASQVAGIAIAIQAGLEYLGLGNPNVPTWGTMLNEAFLNIRLSPMFLVWPALAITLVTASFALLGNAIRDALEDSEPAPRRAGRRAKSTAETAEMTVVDHDDEGQLLTVSDLRVTYPQSNGEARAVVDGVGFSVRRGEVLGIVGESGSGKSQTAFSILGLLPDTATISSGRITLDGVDLISSRGGSRLNGSGISGIRGSKLAYIPQEPISNLDPNFTIGYQLMRPLRRVAGLSKEEARSRAVSLLELVRIPDPERVLGLYPHEISGGMAQRVLIAGAVAGEPDVLIADEPTTALDVTVQAEVLDLLRDLQKRVGMAVVLVTHNFGVVADLCDNVVVMRHSKVVERGPVRQILETPQDDYTKTLLASMLHDKQPRTFLMEGEKR